MEGYRPRSLELRVAFDWSIVALIAIGIAGCGLDSVDVEGRYGQPIPLMTGDSLRLPRLAFADNGCHGPAGGCTDLQCEPLLIDTLAPLTALKGEQLSLARECLEARAARDLGQSEPTDDALAAAVARFRFDDLPIIRAPANPDGWQWAAGDDRGIAAVGGVLGGNMLRRLATEIRSGELGPESVAFYREFPGSESQLADRGWAFLPVQFPGRLLGRHLADRCDLDGEGCQLSSIELASGQPQLALEATRMVFDACVSPPPCTVSYAAAGDDPSVPGECRAVVGEDVDEACVDASDRQQGGHVASLVLATGVRGLVLFSDSAERMFGAFEALPACGAPERFEGAGACQLGTTGALAVTGWPPAGGDDAPLWRLRVRSVAIVPGLARTRGIGPCARLQQRRDALLRQCERFTEDLAESGSIEDLRPPYSARADDVDGEDHVEDPAAVSAAILGETELLPLATTAAPERWLETLVVPATHPLAQAIRRDVAPDAVQPDGLLGTVLFDETAVVLDYTDPNPGLRLRCLDPDDGRCLTAPECRQDSQAACCFGLPLDLRVSFILDSGDNTCCHSLDAQALREIQERGACRGIAPS